MQASVIGGLAIGAVALFVTQKKEKAETLDPLEEFPDLSQDSALAAALHEPVLLFRQLDAAATQSFLVDVQKMRGVLATVNSGHGRPGLVAYLLKWRRSANARLHVLHRLARQRQPLAASDISDDVDMIKKCFDNYVHNSFQQSNLNVLNLT